MAKDNAESNNNSTTLSHDNLINYCIFLIITNENEDKRLEVVHD